MQRASHQSRFDGAMFRAALAYYGLPPHYQRCFTRGESLRRHEVRRDSLTVAAWWFYNAVPGYPERESQAGRVVWVQINLPAADFPLRKAEVPDIETYQNLALDFEYPPEPAVALAIGRDLASHLIDVGLAEPHADWPLNGKPGIPIEVSGAGVHICLPLFPLRTETLGGPEAVNDAVHIIVQRYIQPQFDRLVDRAGIDVRLHLDGSDLGHLFSLPGTWRPPHLKLNECEALRLGFLRHWYRDEEQDPASPYPRRRESAVLSDLIAEECAALVEATSRV
jgi:hypothetical protein